MSAISSAGVVHAITRACSAGNLTECGCDSRYQRLGAADHSQPTGQWHWGGCSDDVNYGVRFAKQFLDRQDKLKFKETKHVRYLMSLHNNNMGREVRQRVVTGAYSLQGDAPRI